jgi:transcriptional regulator with XRE-family HTH domain
MAIYAGIHGTMFTSADRRRQLAELLRTARASLPVPNTRRRRTPGWRREEVADAAGISVTWYTWLEQGRDVQASDAALQRLVRALSLDAAQARYLFELARPAAIAPVTAATPPHLSAFLDGLAPHPAYALDRGWMVIDANAAARDLLQVTAGDNLIEKLLFDTAWRETFADLPALLATSVAQFRAAVGARPEYVSIINSLRARSNEFADLWATAGVQGAPIWTKTVKHPVRGKLVFRYAALSSSDGSDIIVSIYASVSTPAQTAAAL